MKTVQDYIQEIQEASDKDWAKNGYPMDKKPTYCVSQGKVWSKILEKQGWNGGTSVHCFVDKDGNIYKAASWNAPAKGIRGNINNEKKPLLCHQFYMR